MEAFMITGGVPMNGDAAAHGAKNAVLPLLAAVLLCTGEVMLEDCPSLADIDNMLSILEALGCKTRWEGRNIVVDPRGADVCVMPEGLSKQMRSSIFMLGPVLARFGEAEFTYPGGCEIGLRPIDLHLSGLRAMGAKITEGHGRIYCQGRLHGAQIHLDYPSVGATENLMMAAVQAQGDTTIHNAAREPEVRDLAAFLAARGARIRGAGGGTIHIRGKGTVPGAVCLTGGRYRPLSDRIVAGTLMVAGAITGGDVYVRGARAGDIQALLSKLNEMGCRLSADAQGVRVVAPGHLRAARRVETNPYPAFPTDMQAQMMALLSVCCGTAVVVENVFENRFAHAGELGRMGADIEVSGRMAVVRGVRELYGAHVSSRDLRGGAALVLAGLRAQGTTVVDHIAYIDRGYERMENMLCGMGARIVRGSTEE